MTNRLLCAVTRRRLSVLVPEGRSLAPVMESHRGGCLRCQAEEARIRRVVREMAASTAPLRVAPDGLVYGVMSGIESPALPEVRIRGGQRSIAALVGVAVGVAIFRRRSIVQA